MIFKYSLSIIGDDFYPEKLIPKVKSTFTVESYFSPNEQKPDNTNKKYEYGGVFFWHPCKYSTEEQIANYEKGFIGFLEGNYKLFAENGGEEIDIFLEIYYDGEQCNFEIFNKDLLDKLSKFKVSLPISIYVLKGNKLKEWEEETNNIWRDFYSK